MPKPKSKTNSELRFRKVRNVPSPSLGKEKSSIINFYVPYDLSINEMSRLQPIKGQVQVVTDPTTGIIREFIMPPQTRVIMPLGVKITLPEGKIGMFLDKYRIATTTGLVVLSKLVDHDIDSELCVNMFNASTDPVRVAPGKNLVQMILVDASPVKLAEEGIIENPDGTVVDASEVNVETTEAPVAAPESAKTWSEPTSEVKAEDPKFDPNVRLSDEELRRIEAEVDASFPGGMM